MDGLANTDILDDAWPCHRMRQERCTMYSPPIHQMDNRYGDDCDHAQA